MSEAAQRDLIFISKATPGDDQFVLWLATASQRARDEDTQVSAVFRQARSQKREKQAALVCIYASSGSPLRIPLNLTSIYTLNA
ncbi:hypothetical protein [Sphingopyxis sp. 113P3]|uniref:hypothetical protein n=1 Tax=Sphingopyxis sp. (strain 113P3) TaxID=292913 RepID=UPI00118763A0|nr:hypothetical protein [Sphingopyxis sp. 113P3]